MRFFNGNFLVIGIGSVIVTTFSLLLYFDLNRKVNVAEAEDVGTITFKREVAQRKYSSEVVWEEIEQNAPVYNYDSIRTANRSEAVIHLKDGTEIAVNENSLIMVIYSEEQIDVQFSRGSVMAKRVNVESRDIKKLNIKSGSTTVSIEKSDVNLSRTGKEELNLTVNRGNAKINTLSGEKVVKKDQKVVVTGDKDLKVYTLNLKLIAPSPNSYITTPSASKNITFSWQPIGGDQTAFLEVSRDNAFGTVITRRGVSGDSSTLPLRSGIYYWRLTAKNRKTGKTEMSEVRRLSVVRDDPLRLIWPGNGASFVYKKSPPLIHFKWSESTIANGYRLIIARKPSMKDIVTDLRVPGNSIAVRSLTKGVYYWRISEIVSLSGVNEVKQSEVYKLSVDERDLLQPPELTYPPDDETLSRLLLQRKGVTFTWKREGIPESRIYIAKDSRFSALVYSGASKTNFLKVQKELPKGRYYWKVAGFIENREATESSVARSFTITDKETIRLVSPVNGSVLSPEGEKRGARVRFSWEKVRISGKYRLQISRDRGFGRHYKKSTVQASFSVMDNLDPGEYYWRISFLDDDGTELTKSTVYSFVVRDRLEAPVVISPRNGDVVDMQDRDELSFQWKPMDDVTFYRMQLYQIKGGKSSLVLSRRVDGNSFEMRALDKLDIGKFRWTLQAFDTSGGSKRKARMSPAARMNFTITLGKGRIKPELDIPQKLYIE